MPRVYPKISVDWYSETDGPWTRPEEAYHSEVYEMLKDKYGPATAHVQSKKKLGVRLNRYLQFLDKKERLIQDDLDPPERDLVVMLIGLTGGTAALYQESVSATLGLFGDDQFSFRAPAWKEIPNENRSTFYSALTATIEKHDLDRSVFEPLCEWAIVKLKEEALG